MKLQTGIDIIDTVAVAIGLVVEAVPSSENRTHTNFYKKMEYRITHLFEKRHEKIYNINCAPV